ncbi:PilZ domain-containing protein [Bdellovibrio sp. HCB185ZH]|uniref:PilZ domain-containing protein n=1 Tax=Bdellovibrio sp. HCB185ZH TaxID=3394235 RepID=UPI0039A5340A
MSKIWFILNEGQVTGPFEPEEVESQVASFKEPLVWGRGQGEWDTPAKWRTKIKDLPPSTPAGDQSKVWMTRIEGKINKEPMKYADMIVALKKLTDLSQVDISTDGGKTWKEVYALQQVVDDLGISRRSHPRVPIVGTLEFEPSETAPPLKCRVISISEGGLGINDAEGLQIGQKFFATLTSPNLYQTITTTCEVVYMGNDGYAGLRFVGLPEEFKSSVIEYVRKFATVS